jgi:hypothetical protein
MKQQRLQRLHRIVFGDSNPLRRYVDRLESAVAESLVIAFLVAAPLLAIVSVRAVGTSGLREQHAESNWQPVSAVLTQSAGAGLVGLDGEWDTSWVTAKWTAPDGAHRSGIVPVGLNSKAGQRLTVWVTPAGELTPPKLTNAAVVDREITVAIAVLAGLALLLSMTGWAVRVLANRRRIALWTKAWETIGPRWSSFR